jgi:hypothetical protein
MKEDSEFTTALLIIRTSILGTEEIERNLRDDKIMKKRFTSDLYTRISVEFIYLLILLCAISLYQLKGLKKRSRFITSVVDHIALLTSEGQMTQFSQRFKSSMTSGDKHGSPRNIPNAGLDGINKFASQVNFPSFDIQQLNERLKKYSTYKLFPRENEAMEGTLFWEFGIFMSNISCGNCNNIIVVLPSINIAMVAFKHLPIMRDNN